MAIYPPRRQRLLHLAEGAAGKLLSIKELMFLDARSS
jgi:hypothetical protein